MLTTTNATSVVERITPEMAQTILNNHNNGNRNISDVTVRTYANAMRLGEWVLNGEPICFDTEGNLVNGQHRLAAIVKSGCTIEMFVCRGVSSKSFTTYDCGRARTAGQIIGMRDVPNYNTVAGAIKVAYNLRNGRQSVASKNGSALVANNSLTNIQTLALFESDPEGYTNAAKYAVGLRNKFSKTAYGWGYIAGVYYYLTRDKNHPEYAVSNFFDSVFSFNTCDYKMLDLLRIKLQKDMGANVRYTAEYKQNLLAKYWNLYLNDEDRNKISWDKEKEGTIYFK